MLRLLLPLFCLLLFVACQGDDDGMNPMEPTDELLTCDQFPTGWSLEERGRRVGSETDAFAVANRDLILSSDRNQNFNLTTDGGDTWTQFSTGEMIIQHDVEDEFFAENLELTEVSADGRGNLYVGGNYRGNGVNEERQVVLRSTDSGSNWVASFIPSTSNLVSLEMYGEGSGLAILGMLSAPLPFFYYQTSDGGATWTALENPAPGFTLTQRAVSTPGGDLVYRGTTSSGDYGLLRFDIETMTFSMSTPLPSSVINEPLQFVSDQIGFIWSQFGPTLRTDDGGATWREVTAADNSALLEAFMPVQGSVFMSEFIAASLTRWLFIVEVSELDSSTGLAVPERIRVLETRNGGESFEEFNFVPDCDFRQFHTQIAPDEWLFTSGSQTVRLRFDR